LWHRSSACRCVNSERITVLRAIKPSLGCAGSSPANTNNPNPSLVSIYVFIFSFLFVFCTLERLKVNKRILGTFTASLFFLKGKGKSGQRIRTQKHKTKFPSLHNSCHSYNYHYYLIADPNDTTFIRYLAIGKYLTHRDT
jgi:hypothetical protein